MPGSDPKFDELDKHVFNRADGPSSVIAHLEGVLDSPEVPRGIRKGEEDSPLV